MHEFSSCDVVKISDKKNLLPEKVFEPRGDVFEFHVVIIFSKFERSLDPTHEIVEVFLQGVGRAHGSVTDDESRPEGQEIGAALQVVGEGFVEPLREPQDLARGLAAGPARSSPRAGPAPGWPAAMSRSMAVSAVSSGRSPRQR